MKKMLLVLMIGMVLAINVYGFIKDYQLSKVEEIDAIEQTTTIVYVE